MTWWFNEKERDIFLQVDGKIKGRVLKIEAGEELCTVKVSTAVLTHFSLNVENFVWSKNSLTQKFKHTGKSRTLFVKKWREVSELDNSSRSSTSSCSDDDMISGIMCESVDQPNKKRSLDTTDGQSRHLTTPNKVARQTCLTETKLFASCASVHIANLVEPDCNVITRRLDYGHVKELEVVFHARPGQIQLMYGEVPAVVQLDALATPGGPPVAVLGGNHSRMALQSLFDRGLLTNPLVNVNIFTGLDRNEAMKLGLQHNEVHLNSRPVTFMEKVFLMRRLKPAEDMSGIQLRDWKKQLMEIFGYSTIRQVSHNLKHQLRVSRLQELEWQQVTHLVELWDRQGVTGQPSKKSIGEVLKGHLKHQPEERSKAMDMLMSEGYKPYLEALRKLKMDSDEHSCPSDTETVPQPTEIQLLLDENIALKVENEELKAKIKELKKPSGKCGCSCTTEVAKTVEQAETQLNYQQDDDYMVGEKVECLWKDAIAECWYEAVILKTLKSGKYEVQYVLDNVKQRVAKHLLRRT